MRRLPWTGCFAANACLSEGNGALTDGAPQVARVDKAMLLHGMLTAVESALRSRRLPLLNLKTRSFGLDWSGERSGLALWSVQPLPKSAPILPH